MAGISLLALTARAGRYQKEEATRNADSRQLTAAGKAVGEVLRCGLFFWLLFVPAVTISLFSIVLFLLSPTLTDAVLPALWAALTLTLAAARWGALTNRRT